MLVKNKNVVQSAKPGIVIPGIVKRTLSKQRKIYENPFDVIETMQAAYCEHDLHR